MFYSLAGVWSRSCCKRSVGWFGAISRQYAKLDALFADVRQELKRSVDLRECILIPGKS